MIITGPLVRHTTPQELNLWFVTNKRINELRVEAFCDKALTQLCSGVVSQQVVQAGDRCYIYLVSVALTLAEGADSTVYYDIVLDNESFGCSTLRQLLCLENNPLPSVYIPSSHHHRLQASCRKPHASCQKNQSDQLAAALDLVVEGARNGQRPSQLFLTGDQIYADDVSPILLDYLHQLQASLGMGNEWIKRSRGGYLKPEQLKVDGREEPLKKKKGFTSTAKQSHLLNLPEYLCMYLFAFSGVAEGIGFSEYAQLQLRLRNSNVRINKSSRKRKVYCYSYSDYKEDLENLAAFNDSASHKVRTLLANISTYMIFDDHEVTDDWNLTARNQKSLARSDMGKHVLQSALGSYLICQHWGNVPHAEQQLVDLVRRYLAEPTENKTIDLSGLASVYWGYELDQCPPVVVLDTRSQRAFGRGRRHSLSLMNNDQLDALQTKVSQMEPSPSILVVSPTPMFGFSHLEYVQLKFSFLRYFMDREPWIANKDAFNKLQTALSSLQGVRDIVVFSGDVHYAFARRQQFNEDIAFWQLCSSAACNVPTGKSVGIHVAENLIPFFNKERTRYLDPEGDACFLTSDKNIGLLALNDHMAPEKAVLSCVENDGHRYLKTYNLLDPDFVRN